MILKKMMLKRMIVLFVITSFTGWAQCIEQMSVGGSYILVLDKDGSLWTGGNNGTGQLGNGTTENKTELQKIGNETWKYIAPSWQRSFAIQSNGTLWGWGTNAGNIIRDGSTGNTILEPFQIGTDTDWKSISKGYAVCLAVKENGTLWYWGHSPLKDSRVPVQVGDSSSWEVVAVNSESSFWGIKTDGSLWGWGANGSYSSGLGLGTNIPSIIREPEQIGSDYNWKSINISTGILDGNREMRIDICLALKTNGTLWGWGKGITKAGVLTFNANDKILYPVQVGEATDWKEISCLQGHILGLKTDGSLWSVGKNDYGQLGDGTLKAKQQFIQIEAGIKWKAVAAGNGFSAAISEDNRLFTWGNNNKGQLVNGTLTDCTTPGRAGGEEICRTTLAISDLYAENVKIYPNPTAHDITINFGDLLFKEAKVVIYNSLGQIVSQKTIETQTETLQIESASGFYSVKIDFPDGETVIHKVLKK